MRRRPTLFLWLCLHRRVHGPQTLRKFLELCRSILKRRTSLSHKIYFSLFALSIHFSVSFRAFQLHQLLNINKLETGIGGRWLACRMMGTFVLCGCSLCLLALSPVHFFSYVFKCRNQCAAFPEFFAPIFGVRLAEEA